MSFIMSRQSPKNITFQKSKGAYSKLKPEKKSLAVAIAMGMNFAKAGVLIDWSRQRVRYNYHNDLSFRSAIEAEKEKIQKELRDIMAERLKKIALEAVELLYRKNPALLYVLIHGK